MKRTDKEGRVYQTMHAVFEGSKQLTAWRTSRVSTMAALHRSSHHTNKKRTRQKMLNGVEVTQQLTGEPKVRDRVYHGLTMRTQTFVTPGKISEAA
jgi:hypothetical protein